MLENLPDAVGEALDHVRAGLENTLRHAIDLRQGTARLQLGSLAFVDHGPIPERYTADGPGSSPPLQWSGVPPQAVELVHGVHRYLFQLWPLGEDSPRLA